MKWASRLSYSLGLRNQRPRLSDMGRRGGWVTSTSLRALRSWGTKNWALTGKYEEHKLTGARKSFHIKQQRMKEHMFIFKINVSAWILAGWARLACHFYLGRRLLLLHRQNLVSSWTCSACGLAGSRSRPPPVYQRMCKALSSEHLPGWSPPRKRKSREMPGKVHHYYCYW